MVQLRRNGMMLLFIFTFLSSLNPYEVLKSLNKSFFEVQQRSVKIKLREIHFDKKFRNTRNEKG